MITRDDILTILHGIIHPESNSDLVSLGMVDNLQVNDGVVSFSLAFSRSRDPLAATLKKRCEVAIQEAYPQTAGKITIFIKEVDPKTKKGGSSSDSSSTENLSHIKNIIAVSSTKGGVGKSTVTANLALALSRMNYRVGILDADVYGPSQPVIFSLEDYRPSGRQVDGMDLLMPADAFGIKLMSIGFFIEPHSALIWRGPMATTALKQMIHQTEWGELDFLLVDLPPGTGDVHITLISEMDVAAALVVSTPQKLALSDVVRGVGMFRNDKVNIPILGLIENMAWFTPAETPDKRYYIFGKSGAKKLAIQSEMKLLGEIPLILTDQAEENDSRLITESIHPAIKYYDELSGNVIHQLNKVKNN